VEHGDKAELAVELPLGIGSEVLQHPVDRAEELVEQQPTVDADERMQVMRERENRVEVRHGQEFGPAVLNPLLFARGLAGGTVLIPAGVVERHLGPAGVAAIEMAAQRGGAALEDVPDGLAGGLGHGMRPAILRPVGAEHVRYPQVRGLHDQFFGRQSKGLTTECRCSLVT